MSKTDKKQNNSHFYKLEELKSSIENGIESAKLVARQQIELVNILETSKREFITDDFIKGLKTSTEQINAKIEAYEKDYAKVNKLLSLKDDKLADEIISTLLEVMKVV